MEYSNYHTMTTILFLITLTILSIIAVSFIIYGIIVYKSAKSPTLTLITPDKVVTIPLNNLHSITAVSQGQVLVTTILQEQFVGVLVKI